MRALILAAAAVALLAGPAAAKKKEVSTTVATPATATTGPAMSTTTTAAPKGTSKMGMCAKQWDALGAGKAAYNAKAKTMKSKKGNAMSGYNAFTSECMKKKV